MINVCRQLSWWWVVKQAADTVSYTNPNVNGTRRGGTGQGKQRKMVQFCGSRRGWEWRGGLVVKLQCVCVCLCVCYWRGGKRKKQFMVYERMSEIGEWQRKSVAAVVVGCLVCCGKNLDSERVGDVATRKESNILLHCVKEGWWKRKGEYNLFTLSMKMDGLVLSNYSILAYSHYRSLIHICVESDWWLNFIRVTGGLDIEIIGSSYRNARWEETGFGVHGYSSGSLWLYFNTAVCWVKSYCPHANIDNANMLLLSRHNGYHVHRLSFACWRAN